MDITQDELRFIFNLGKESMTTRVEKYEHEMYDNMKREYNSMREFLHFVHMHYPQAIAEYDAVNKIKES